MAFTSHCCSIPHIVDAFLVKKKAVKPILILPKKGTLILLHGRLPHYSCENKSDKSRHAYTLHAIDSTCEYPKFNWLQRSTNLPLKGFID